MNPEIPSSNITRREMLTRTGAIGAGILASNLVLPTSAPAAQIPDVIRVGLIGCGGRGTGALGQTLSVPDSYAKVVAMADAFEGNLKKSYSVLKKAHEDKVDVPEDRKFVGLDGYKKVFEHCDVVILATPPGFRPFHFQAAVEAGKHIFMEKPVCVDSYGARLVDKVAKQADEKKLKIVVGFQRRYQNHYLAAYKQIQDGVIGDIMAGYVYWNSAPIWYRDREPGMSEMQFQINNWYHFLWLCGGQPVEQHVHNIDVANWFIGAVPVEASVGMGGRLERNPKKPSEIYDHHAIEYRYPNGVIVSSQCRQIANTKPEIREEFHGTKGIVTTDMVGNAMIRDYKGNVIWQHKSLHPDPNPYQLEHNAFHKALRDDKVVNNTHYALSSSFTGIMGRCASYTGQPAKWKETWDLDYRTMPEKVGWDTNPPHMPDKDGQYPLPTPGHYDYKNP